MYLPGAASRTRVRGDGRKEAPLVRHGSSSTRARRRMTVKARTKGTRRVGVSSARGRRRHSASRLLIERPGRPTLSRATTARDQGALEAHRLQGALRSGDPAASRRRGCGVVGDGLPAVSRRAPASRGTRRPCLTRPPARLPGVRARTPVAKIPAREAS